MSCPAVGLSTDVVTVVACGGPAFPVRRSPHEPVGTADDRRPARCVALAAEWGVPLTEDRVKRATESGQLPRFIVCAKLRYSSRHAWRWLYGSTSGCGTR